MKVLIYDRTEELNGKLRKYTEQRLGKLSRHFEKVLEAEVHFDPESRRSHEPEKSVRIIVRMGARKTPVLKAEERGRELQAALDLALDKIDRQVLRLKDKIVDRHRAGATPDESPEHSSATITEEPERVIQRVKAESIEQARQALDANGYQFHLYLNEDTGELNVIYLRADGSLAIIEPKIT